MDDEIRKALSGLTTDVITAGAAYGLKRNAAYRAWKTGDIEGFKIGGKVVVPTAPIRRKLGLDQEARAA